MGSAASATVIAHTGVPFPLYINTDINGDGVANSGFSHNNDRPSLLLPNGNARLVGRYPYDQPGFAELDARIQKDFNSDDRYHVLLSGDFYNLTNRGNVYSDPDTNATLDFILQIALRGLQEKSVLTARSADVSTEAHAPRC